MGLVVAERSPDAVVRPDRSAQPLVNPLTGQYLWFPQDHPEAVPAGARARDSYSRFVWKDLEPTEGRYTFSMIDEQLAAAEQRGGRFAFRVMAVCTTCAPDALPADVSALPTTWTAATPAGPVRLPDWNDPAFLERWRRFVTALGERYDEDPRLAYVDVGGYGNWGEGHTWPFEHAYPGPDGRQPAQPWALLQMTEAVVTAFPHTFAVLNPPHVAGADGRLDEAASEGVLRGALRQSRRLGLRNDCLGGSDVQASATRILESAQAKARADGAPTVDQPLQRWRIAPFITEWCDNIRPDGAGGSFSQGERQVRDWHITQVSNGNFQHRVETYPPGEQEAFVQAQAHAGFELGVVEARVVRDPQGAARLEVQWRNDGSAPPYDRWLVTYRLATGGASIELASGLDLRDLLGNGATATDAVALPPDVPVDRRGGATLEARVTDPGGYLPAMQLVTGTPMTDGAYRLGDIVLR